MENIDSNLVDELCEEIKNLSEEITKLGLWTIIDSSVILRKLDGEYYLVKTRK